VTLTDHRPSPSPSDTPVLHLTRRDRDDPAAAGGDADVRRKPDLAMLWRRSPNNASSDVTVQLVPLSLNLDSAALPLLSTLGLFMDLKLNMGRVPRRLHTPGAPGAAQPPTRTETAKVGPIDSFDSSCLIFM
jgi:hypothetical protein